MPLISTDASMLTTELPLALAADQSQMLSTSRAGLFQDQSAAEDSNAKSATVDRSA